jgi:iron-sulfur cluster repair protein YtfE (RIC family)
MKIITKDCTIEDLVNDYPFTVKYLMQNGIRCLVCGEPIWGTLEQAALEKGFSSEQIDNFVKELNKLQENN